MSSQIAAESLFVPTDEAGRQEPIESGVRWNLPEAGGGCRAGEPHVPAGEVAKVLPLDALLDQLGSRIFVAEVRPGGPVLVSETAWSVRAAAGFALDCADHVASSSDEPVVVGDLTAAIAAARSYLAEADDESAGVLGRFRRLSIARSLKKEAGRLGSESLVTAVDVEADDGELLADPVWTSMAATTDAVLAAVAAVHHAAFPHLSDASIALYEETKHNLSWGVGSFGHAPAATSARDAAERARQSAADMHGPGAGEGERAWQRERLLAALRGG